MHRKYTKYTLMWVSTGQTKCAMWSATRMAVKIMLPLTV